MRYRFIAFFGLLGLSGCSTLGDLAAEDPSLISFISQRIRCEIASSFENAGLVPGGHKMKDWNAAGWAVTYNIIAIKGRDASGGINPLSIATALTSISGLALRGEVTKAYEQKGTVTYKFEINEDNSLTCDGNQITYQPSIAPKDFKLVQWATQISNSIDKPDGFGYRLEVRTKIDAGVSYRIGSEATNIDATQGGASNRVGGSRYANYIVDITGTLVSNKVVSTKPGVIAKKTSRSGGAVLTFDDAFRANDLILQNLRDIVN